MPVVPITSYAQFKSIINGDQPVLIDFWAPWCGPCKAISPVLAKFSDETTGVQFYKVDIDDAPDIAEEVQIRVIPTFMIFKDGAKIKEFTGAQPAALKAFVTEAAALK